MKVINILTSLEMTNMERNVMQCMSEDSDYCCNDNIIEGKIPHLRQSSQKEKKILPVDEVISDCKIKSSKFSPATVSDRSLLKK